MATYICFDNDMAGKKTTVSAIEKMSDCLVIVFPEGIKDADEFVEKGGDMDRLRKEAITGAEFILKQDWIPNVEKMQKLLKLLKNDL